MPRPTSRRIIWFAASMLLLAAAGRLMKHEVVLNRHDVTTGTAHRAPFMPPEKAGAPPESPVPVSASVPSRQSFTEHPALSSGASVIGAAWETELQPECVAFQKWTQRWLSAAQPDAAMQAEGIALARNRRAFLTGILSTEPARVLAAAVPWRIRNKLPADVAALLEERVDGAGEFQSLCAQPTPGQSLQVHDWYEALVSRRSYRSYPTGPARTRTLGWASLHGVAFDRELALTDSPVRVVEQGEPLSATRPLDTKCPSVGEHDNTGAPVMLDAGDRYVQVCSLSHAGRIERTIAAQERRMSPWIEDTNATRNLASGGSGGSDGFLSSQPPEAWTTGTKRLLVIRVDFSDLTGTPVNATAGNAPISESAIVNVINGPGGVRDFFDQCSFRRAGISLGGVDATGDSPDVTAVLRMPHPASYYSSTGANTELHADARALAASAGFDLSAYPRVAVLFSFLGAKINYAGLGNVSGPYFWINGWASVHVFAHELGHTFGLPHAGREQVSVDDPVATGAFQEYDDALDTMGNAEDTKAHFNMWSKSYLHWIDAAGTRTITSNGVYRVGRFDHAWADPGSASLPLALRIPRKGGVEYWIGHRGLFTANHYATDGAYIIWARSDGGHTRLIDCNRPMDSVATNAPLTIGQTLTDSTEGISIKTVRRGGSGADEWFDIQVTIESRVEPAASIPVADETLAVYNHLLLRTRATNTTVSGTWTTMPGTATPAFDYLATSGPLSWVAGDASPLLLPVTILPDSQADDGETFLIGLNNLLGAVPDDQVRVSTVTIRSPGAADFGFRNSSAGSIPNISGEVLTAALDRDGSLVIGGWFDNFGTRQHDFLARLKRDGTEDTTFYAPAFVGLNTATSGPVRAIAIQPDGKLLIGGGFQPAEGAHRLLRLNADGSLDASFAADSGIDGDVTALALQPDGRVLVGGRFQNYRSTGRHGLVRLNADGSIDESFASPAFAAGVTPYVYALALTSDGKVLVGGEFIINDSAPRMGGLLRLNSDGSIDPSFQPGDGTALSASTVSGTVLTISLLADGRITFGGTFTSFSGETRAGVATLQSSGTWTPWPASGLDGAVHCVLPLPDGGLLAGGVFTETSAGAPARYIARLLPSGNWDSNWAARCEVNATVNAVVLDPSDHRLYAAGTESLFDKLGTTPVFRLLSGQSPPAAQIAHDPDDLIVDEGEQFTLSVRATAPRAWCQWFRNGAPVSGASNLDHSQIAAATDSGAWQARITTESGVVLSREASVIVRFQPAITLQPAAHRVNLGQAAAFTIGAKGGDLTYQWQRGDSNIDGATSSTLTIPVASEDDAVNYRCVVSNSQGSATSNAAALTVVAPPIVRTHPEDVAILVGQRTTLRVTVDGLFLSYQWQRDGEDLPGATLPTLTITGATSRAGAYRCIAANSAGSAISESGQVHVVVKPVILTQPLAQTVSIGTPALLAVTASGEFLTYRWQKAGVNIPGAVTASLALPAVAPADAGSYRCIVSNVAGSVVSHSAMLRCYQGADESAPLSVDAPDPPSAIVSGSFSWQLSATRYPCVFSASGLPSGLRCDAATGLISGTPNASGSFKITVIARDSVHAAASRIYALPVESLPAGVRGNFSALVARDQITNNAMGGFITLSVGGQGFYTGKMFLGARGGHLKGRVQARPGGQVQFDMLCTMGDRSVQTLMITFAANEETIGGLVDGSSIVTGARHVWSAARPANAFAGSYNVSLRPAASHAGDLSVPLGSGYQVMTVSSSGRMSSGGRLADGTVLLHACTLWPDGRAPFFAMLNNKHGSITGAPVIASGRATGALTWWKSGAANAADHTYASGFGTVVNLDADGSLWTKATPGSPVLGLSSARIVFADASTGSAAQAASLGQLFSISGQNKAQFSALDNPCGVKLKLYPDLGVFSGSFQLRDPGASSGAVVLRTATVYGVLLSHRREGAGFFTLPQLPGGAGASVLSGSTLITSP